MIHRYSIEFLIALRDCGRAPVNIKEIQAAIVVSSANHPPKKRYGQQQHAWRRDKPPQPPQRPCPSIAVTKMPIKTSKSEVVLLLNQLGGDNAKAIATKIHGAIEAAEQRGELITFIHDKTMAQPALSMIFADMWFHVFQADCTIRTEYLDRCQKRFKSLSYVDTDAILEICHAMAASFAKRIVSLTPITSIMRGLVNNLLLNVHGGTQGLDVLVNAYKPPRGPNRMMATLDQSARTMADPVGVLEHMFSTVSKDEHCTNIYPHICSHAARLIGRPALDLVLETCLAHPSSSKMKLLILMSALYPVDDVIARLSNELVSGLDAHPGDIEAIIVLFQMHSSIIPNETISKMDEAAAVYMGSANMTMRLKFKYMDYMDLRGTMNQSPGK